jgi:hypothetical protein
MNNGSYFAPSPLPTHCPEAEAAGGKPREERAVAAVGFSRDFEHLRLGTRMVAVGYVSSITGSNPVGVAL